MITTLFLLLSLLISPTHASPGSYTSPSSPSSLAGDSDSNTNDALVDVSSTVSCAALDGQLSPTLQHGQMVRCTVDCRWHSTPVMAVVTPFTFCSELTSTADTRTATGSTSTPRTFCLAGSTVCSELNATSSSGSSNTTNSTFAYGNIADVQVDSTTSALSFSWFAPLVGTAAFLRVEINSVPITNSPIIVLLSGDADGTSGSANGGSNPSGGSDSSDPSNEGVFAVGSRNFFIVVSFGVALLLIVAVWLRSCVRAHQKHRELEVREERDKLWLQNVGAADMRSPFRSWYDTQ